MTVHDIGFYLLLLVTLHIAHFWFVNWRNVYCDLRGQDVMWQIIEIIGIHAVLVWTAMVLADSFFQFRASDQAWTSINLVLGVAVLGIVGKGMFNRWTDAVTQRQKDDHSKEPAPH